MVVLFKANHRLYLYFFPLSLFLLFPFGGNVNALPFPFVLLCCVFCIFSYEPCTAYVIILFCVCVFFFSMNINRIQKNRKELQRTQTLSNVVTVFLFLAYILFLHFLLFYRFVEFLYIILSFYLNKHSHDQPVPCSSYTIF